MRSAYRAMARDIEIIEIVIKGKFTHILDYVSQLKNQSIQNYSIFLIN